MVLAGCMALAGVFRVSTDIDEGVPDPQTQKKKVRPSTALVTTATEAPSTPPPPCAAHRSCGNCLTQSGCYWCANADSFEVDQSSGRCIDSSTPSFAVTCEDIEDNSCPFILSENYKANTAANFRVIHVGIQKGGPEALIQMHLALLFWGFRTTLDTRKNKQGMEIKPFFKKAYSTELARSPELRWFGSYDEWLTTGKPEDVFIETETWKCRQNLQYFQGKGRQLQWHLTVWKKNNREDCTISAHTHYIAKDYMHISTRAVMYPYISPHIHKLSSAAVLKDPSFKDKENLVMYDADAGLTEKDFVLKGAVSFTTRIAQGLKPEVLYALYAKAKVCIDMKMPGAERFVYEAALFGCCIITDRDGNGADDLDLPIPARFKIAPGDMVTLNKRVQEILGSFEEVSKEFAPLRRFVTSQRVSFLRQVRRYYSDNIHIVGFMGEGRTEGELLSFVLSHVLSTPFATVEVVQCAGQEVKLNAGTFRTLRERTLLAAVKFTTAQCTGDAELAAGYALPFPGRVSHVLAYTDIRYVPSLEDLVAVLSTELDSQHEASHGDKTALSLGPHILFAFSKHFAYVWKCWLHGSCRNVHPTTADTMYKSQVSPLIASMQSSDLMPTEFLCQHPVYANKSVQTLLPTKVRC